MIVVYEKIISWFVAIIPVREPHSLYHKALLLLDHRPIFSKETARWYRIS